MTYFLAAVAASGVFVAAGWRSKNAKALRTARGWQDPPVDPLWGETEVEAATVDGKADVGSTMRQVLKRLGPLMASQFVQAEIAAPFGLSVRMKSAALTDLLEELLTASIRSAPASRILLTATAHGEQVYVGVTDDMPGADHAVRQGRIRSLMERVAMLGGALEVSVRPSEGTTVTLRLAAAIGRDRPNRDSGKLPAAASGAIGVTINP